MVIAGGTATLLADRRRVLVIIMKRHRQRLHRALEFRSRRNLRGIVIFMPEGLVPGLR
jgi:hypothetical protein